MSDRHAPCTQCKTDATIESVVDKYCVNDIWVQNEANSDKNVERSRRFISLSPLSMEYPRTCSHQSPNPLPLPMSFSPFDPKSPQHCHSISSSDSLTPMSWSSPLPSNHVHCINADPDDLHSIHQCAKSTTTVVPSSFLLPPSTLAPFSLNSHAQVCLDGRNGGSSGSDGDDDESDRRVDGDAAEGDRVGSDANDAATGGDEGDSTVIEEIFMSNIMFWNVQGIRQKLNSSEVCNFLSTYQIFSLAEIHNCSQSLLESIFDQYNVFVKYRKDHAGGGLAVFIRKNLANFIKPITLDNNMECLLFTVEKEILPCPCNIIICFVYVPHEYSVVFNGQSFKGVEQLEDLFYEISTSYNDIPWLIVGDLNSRTGSLSDTLVDAVNRSFGEEEFDLYFNDECNIPCRSSRDTEFNNYGMQLTRFCKVNKMCIINGRIEGDVEGKITCIANAGKSVVDYAICDQSIFDLFDQFKVLPRDESDHFPISLSFRYDTNSTSCPNESHVYEPLDCFSTVKWNEDKKDIYAQRTSEKLLENLDIFDKAIKDGNVDGAVRYIDQCVRKGAGVFGPSKKKNYGQTAQAGWFDNDCVVHKKEKYRLLNKFSRTNSTEDLNAYLECRKKFKLLCRQKKRCFLENRSIAVLESSLKLSKTFWKEINLVCKSKQSAIQNNIKPHEWLQYFKNLLHCESDNHNNPDDDAAVTTGDNTVNGNMFPTHLDHQCDDMNREITPSEVLNSIKDLKRGKAPGPDGLGSDFFMITSPIFIDCLTKTFNSIFTSGKYPLEWTKSMIFPLHKKGNSNNVNNYRGISLLNILGKIFSKIINTRLYDWAENEGLIPEEQAGFRKGYSTVDNIFNLQCFVEKYICKPKGRFYVFYVDFQKAFDMVNRELLWKILSEKGCKGHMLDTLQAMYGNVSMCIKISNNKASGGQENELEDLCHLCLQTTDCCTNIHLTKYFSSTSGVRQGCILSPLLFSMFISELVNDMNSSRVSGVQVMPNDKDYNCLLFADDLSIIADTVIEMQKKIKVLEEYCIKWKMQVNLTKSKIVVFRNGGYLKESEKWFFMNTKVDAVTYYNYLGVIFSSRLCWSSDINTKTSKVARSISMLRGVFNKLRKVNIRTAAILFDMKIKPMLLYGSEIWGTEILTEVEKSQITYFKAFLGVGRSTQNAYVLSEVNRFHLFVDYILRAVRYWCKLIFTDHSRLIKKAYVAQYNCSCMGHKNWASRIKSVLYSYGFGHVWQAQQIGDPHKFLSEFKQRLIDVSLQMRHSNIENVDPMLSSLSNNCLPSYIYLDLAISDKRLITLLRTRSLPLRNNLNRINVVDDNICKKCCMHAIEDECHFLFECANYNVLRHACPFIVNTICNAPNTSEALLMVLSDNVTQTGIMEILNFIKDSRLTVLST